MEVEFESSVEEEEVSDLGIVISEVCSVLDAEQCGRVVKNPLFTDNSDEDDEEDLSCIEVDVIESTRKRCSDVGSNSENNLFIHNPLEASSYASKVETDSEVDTDTKKSQTVSASLRARSESSCVDDVPNQGLCDEENYLHGNNEDYLEEAGYPTGSLVWAKMKGYPPWPAIVVPDPASGKSRELRKGGNYHHVLFLEYRNEVAWIHRNQLKAFTRKGSGKVKKGNGKALVKAVELGNSLNDINCMERIGRFIEYQNLNGQPTDCLERKDYPKLFLSPVIRLKRLKVVSKPVVMLKRLKIESPYEADFSDCNSDDLLGKSDNDEVFTSVKSPSRPSCDSRKEWCEGMLVWARVEGYPFWPAVIVREQKSDEFSIPSKAGLVRIHVMFLAFHKQTALIRETSLVPFHSADQFIGLLNSSNKKSQKDFRPSKTLAPKYNLAVKTAIELLPRSLYNRLEYLYT